MFKRPIAEKNIPNCSLFLNSERKLPIFVTNNGLVVTNQWRIEVNNIPLVVTQTTSKMTFHTLSVKGEYFGFEYECRKEGYVGKGWYRLFHKKKAEDAISILLLS